MIRYFVLPVALVVLAVPALAQDRTLPAGAFQHETTPAYQGTNNAYEAGLQQGRSEASTVRRHRKSDVVR